MQDAAIISATAFDDLPREQLAAIEVLTKSLGQEIFANLADTQPHVWQRRWWDDRMLAWSMRDERLKVQLFRFVDVLPMLESSDAVMEHLHEYLDSVRDKLREAESALGRSAPDAMGQALDKAAELARGMESLDQRMRERAQRGQNQQGQQGRGQQARAGQEGQQVGAEHRIPLSRIRG